MIITARILLTGLWLWFLVLAARSGAEGASSESQGTLFHIAMILVLSLPLAAVWTPYVAEGLFGGLVDSVNGDHADPEKNVLAHWIRRAEARKQRRRVVFLCWWEGVMVHPNLQRPFYTGMLHAKRGSWLEWFFAQEVLRFGDARHVMEAMTVLERHGVQPRAHWSESITEMMQFRRRRVSPPVPAISLPKPDGKEAPVPKRNLQIKLFASAGLPPAAPGGGRSGTRKIRTVKNVSHSPQP
jgi:hypothetical protein